MPITAHRISVSHEQGRWILRDIDLLLRDKNITLIIGRNGAGKSTLLEALTGLIPLSAGVITYDDEPLWDDDKRLNSAVLGRIGQVFQSPEQQLFASTVRGEFAYSLKYMKLSRDEVVRLATDAMAMMQLSPSMSDESPHLLSGGQKRRLALATTIATNPDWLLLDEPTAGLDAHGIRALIEFLLTQRQHGRSIVIATHDIETLLPHADRIIVLHGGTVAADLTREEFMSPYGADMLALAGIQQPSALALMRMLNRCGSILIQDRDEWFSPEKVADVIDQSCRARTITSSDDRSGDGAATCTSDVVMRSVGKLDVAISGTSLDVADSLGSSQHEEWASEKMHASRPVDRSNYLTKLDPRAKWLFYMFVSIGILIQGSWLGFLIGSILAVAIIVHVRVPWRPMLIVVIPLVIFIIFSLLISGVSLDDGVTVDLGSSLRTVFELLKILIVSMFGLTLATVTSQLMMKSAIEKSLRGLKRLRIPVEAIALGGSLMLRFIPLFIQEYRRFGKIVKARAKERTRRNGVRLRQLPVLFTPMIISLLQIASDLTTAMQARGLTSFHMERTSRVQLRMGTSDWLVVLLGILVFVVLIIIEIVV